MEAGDPVVEFGENLMRFFLLCFCCVCLATAVQARDVRPDNNESWAKAYLMKVKQGSHSGAIAGKDLVSSKEIAIDLAVVAWKAIYGVQHIRKQAPYQAYRIEDCWVVTGVLPKPMLGGTAKAVIRAKDGQFLNISHDR